VGRGGQASKGSLEQIKRKIDFILTSIEEEQKRETQIMGKYSVKDADPRCRSNFRLTESR
jgi:hypothetical protein